MLCYKQKHINICVKNKRFEIINYNKNRLFFVYISWSLPGSRHYNAFLLSHIQQKLQASLFLLHFQRNKTTVNPANRSTAPPELHARRSAAHILTPMFRSVPAAAPRRAHSTTLGHMSDWNMSPVVSALKDKVCSEPPVISAHQTCLTHKCAYGTNTTHALYLSLQPGTWNAGDICGPIAGCALIIRSHIFIRSFWYRVATLGSGPKAVASPAPTKTHTRTHPFKLEHKKCPHTHTDTQTLFILMEFGVRQTTLFLRCPCVCLCLLQLFWMGLYRTVNGEHGSSAVRLRASRANKRITRIHTHTCAYIGGGQLKWLPLVWPFHRGKIKRTAMQTAMPVGRIAGLEQWRGMETTAALL